MAKNQYRLEGSSITAMIDELNQYKLGNITNEGLLQSAKELEAEIEHIQGVLSMLQIQDEEAIKDAVEQYLADDDERVSDDR